MKKKLSTISLGLAITAVTFTSIWYHKDKDTPTNMQAALQSEIHLDNRTANSDRPIAATPVLVPALKAIVVGGVAAWGVFQVAWGGPKSKPKKIYASIFEKVAMDKLD